MSMKMRTAISTNNNNIYYNKLYSLPQTCESLILESFVEYN